jgi:hypothetical protein
MSEVRVFEEPMNQTFFPLRPPKNIRIEHTVDVVCHRFPLSPRLGSKDVVCPYIHSVAVNNVRRGNKIRTAASQGRGEIEEIRFDSFELKSTCSVALWV